MQYRVIKHLILQKIHNMMDINVDSNGSVLQWFINVLMEKSSGETVKNEAIYDKELAEELHKQIIENLRKEKYTHLLYIIFVTQI